jgi:aminopeptidase-like protein
VCQELVGFIESNHRYRNRSPYGEPQLGKRGLYGAVGGREPQEREHALLWVLNQSDGSRSLLDIAQRSGLKYATLKSAADELQAAKLLALPRVQRARAARRRPRKANRGRSKS